MITQSPRTEHLAAHVTPDAKLNIQRLARARLMSVSALVSELVEAYIKKVHTENKNAPHPCEDRS